MTVPSDPAERHRRFSREFADTIAHVHSWDAPTPVPEWTAVDVPAHLIGWFPWVLHRFTGIELPDATADPAQDPATAWHDHWTAVQAVLEDDDLANQVVAEGPFAGMPVAGMIDRMYTADVFAHRWDLARSHDLDPQLDPDFCDELVAGMSSIEDMLRASGQYGPRVEVPASASPAEKLAGFLGRDPYWKPRS
jgi:uncharacterized protein (TIGR03086 family)